MKMLRVWNQLLMSASLAIGSAAYAASDAATDITTLTSDQGASVDRALQVELTSDGLGLVAEMVKGQIPSEIKDMPDRKSTRLNSSHIPLSRMPSSA